jgi:DNA-binding SARP family transcriptional activator
MMRIEVLGPLRVLMEGRELTTRDFRGAKPKQILQLLVVERGHTVPKDRLADLLWERGAPRNHVATLEAYVSVLRQVLAPGGPPRTSIVLTERGGYRLDTTRVQVDLDDFDRALDQASKEEPQAALETLKRALLLVRGSALEDEPYAGWARTARDAYTQRHVQALIDAGRLSLLTGDATGALALAEQAVALNPLAEAAYQVLMTAAYSLWRQDEALAAFDRCRRLLAQELGADPHDETVALHLSILRHENLAQMLPGPRRAAGPPAVTDPLPLVGRDAELQQLRTAAACAAAGRFTTAVVCGPTGVGKTRLVETLADELDLPVARNRCSDLESGFPYLALSLALRQVLPDRAGDGLPGLVDLLQRTERAQPIDEFARLRVMEQLAAELRDRPPFLLVLDDVQWADPETVTTLSYLQRRCPEARVLVVLAYDRLSSPSAALRALRPDLRIDLRELPRTTVERLGGAELHQAAGGNPAHIASWLAARARGLSETFTPEFRDRIVTACWDLGPQSFRLLCAASSLEQQTFSAELLAHLVEAREMDVADELDRLLEQDLLQVVDRDFTFRSPAIRSVLRATLSPARLSLLQQAAAGFGVTGPRRRATDRPAPEPAGRVLLPRRAADALPNGRTQQ